MQTDTPCKEKERMGIWRKPEWVYQDQKNQTSKQWTVTGEKQTFHNNKRSIYKKNVI